MSRFALAAALALALAPLAAGQAAAAPSPLPALSVPLTCTATLASPYTLDGLYRLAIVNPTGKLLPKGAHVALSYVVKGKTETRTVVLRRALTAGGTVQVGLVAGARGCKAAWIKKIDPRRADPHAGKFDPRTTVEKARITDR